jgi:hypothetical protein
MSIEISYAIKNIKVANSDSNLCYVLPNMPSINSIVTLGFDNVIDRKS